jgi:hypothetical protein
MQTSKLPIEKSGGGVLSFSVDVAANAVVAVQVRKRCLFAPVF